MMASTGLLYVARATSKSDSPYEEWMRATEQEQIHLQTEIRKVLARIATMEERNKKNLEFEEAMYDMGIQIPYYLVPNPFAPSMAETLSVPKDVRDVVQGERCKTRHEKVGKRRDKNEDLRKTLERLEFDEWPARVFDESLQAQIQQMSATQQAQLEEVVRTDVPYRAPVPSTQPRPPSRPIPRHSDPQSNSGMYDGPALPPAVIVPVGVTV